MALSPETKNLLRKRILPAAFIMGMAFLVQYTCDRQSRYKATVDFAVTTDTRALEAIVRGVTDQPDADPIATLRCVLPGPCRFDVTLPDPDATVAIDLTLADGTHKQLTRSIRAASDGASVTINAK